MSVHRCAECGDIAVYDDGSRYCEKHRPVPDVYPGDALARNAFDVMMRRGWGVAKFTGGVDDVWFAIEDRDGPIVATGCGASDPFTALVLADASVDAAPEPATIQSDRP